MNNDNTHGRLLWCEGFFVVSICKWLALGFGHDSSYIRKSFPREFCKRAKALICRAQIFLNWGHVHLYLGPHEVRGQPATRQGLDPHLQPTSLNQIPPALYIYDYHDPSKSTFRRRKSRHLQRSESGFWRRTRTNSNVTS